MDTENVSVIYHKFTNLQWVDDHCRALTALSWPVSDKDKFSGGFPFSECPFLCCLKDNNISLLISMTEILPIAERIWSEVQQLI